MMPRAEQCRSINKRNVLINIIIRWMVYFYYKIICRWNHNVNEIFLVASFDFLSGDVLVGLYGDEQMARGLTLVHIITASGPV